MKNLIVLVGFSLLVCVGLRAQGSFVWGIKGGPVIGFQKWNGFDQDVLLSYHGDIFIETYDETNNAVALFAQAGYHVRGSAHRNNRFTLTSGDIFNAPANTFEFYNAVLTLGAKKKNDLGLASKWFYSLGVRGEYTIDTNLDDYLNGNQVLSCAYYPLNGFVRRIQYGVYVGGGLEFPFSELIGGSLEFSVNPDFSQQYDQPTIANAINRCGFTSNSQSIPERRINNLSFEITLGLRFLRKVIYVD